MINTQIRLAILGYGKECSKKNAAYASTIGKFSGKQGISLVAGNVGATFDHAFTAAKAYQVATICVIEKHKRTARDHKASEVIRTPDTYSKHHQITHLSDAAILIGGGAGTLLLLQHFLKDKKTVIAINGTGGIADSQLPPQVIKAAHPREAFKILMSIKKQSLIETDLGLLQLSYNHFALSEMKIVEKAAENLLQNKDKDSFKDQLIEYFAGKRTEFLGKLFLNGSEFQMKVWKALLDIPYGKRMEYGELAELLGDKKASSAVGHVSVQNPIWIIIPCHRLKAKDGSFTEYAGGLEMKMRLLDIEKHQTELRIF
jgi:methylated-DNA-[protein]-cysteine S-methyltransferase